MIAFHPPLSSTPAAFIALLAACELGLWGDRREHLGLIRTVLVHATVAACLCAFFSGYQASADAGALDSFVEDALSSHHAWGRMVLINSILVAIFHWTARIATYNRNAFRAAYGTALLAQIGLTLYVGYLGGQLVFSHGVGVVKP